MYRIKKILFVSLLDIWFEEQFFCEAEAGIKVLHTNEKLSNEKYDFYLAGKTFLLDISSDIETIFKGFEYKSCRYAINKAQKDGIIVKKGISVQEKQRYLSFQNDFCKQKQIPFVNKNEMEFLEVYYAETPDGEYLGGCSFLLSEDKKTVRYKYGATAHKFNANEMILWRAICDYHKREYKIFDFGGVVPTDDKESYYYKHFRFKQKFGGELTDSYTYFKVSGGFRIFYYIFLVVLKVAFHGDVNGLVVWLNKKGFLS